MKSRNYRLYFHFKQKVPTLEQLVYEEEEESPFSLLLMSEEEVALCQSASFAALRCPQMLHHQFLAAFEDFMEMVCQIRLPQQDICKVRWRCGCMIFFLKGQMWNGKWINLVLLLFVHGSVCVSDSAVTATEYNNVRRWEHHWRRCECYFINTERGNVGRKVVDC